MFPPLSSVVFPLLLHRSSAAAVAAGAAPPPVYVTWLVRTMSSRLEAYKDAVLRNDGQTTSEGGRQSGAAERRTLPGGETLGGGDGENRERSHHFPQPFCSLPPSHCSSSYLDTIHYTRAAVPGQRGHSFLIKTLIEPVSRHQTPAGVFLSPLARRFGL